MENTRSRNKSQDESLPPGFFVGVIPPDGTQLALPIWMTILCVDQVDEEAFKQRLRKDKIISEKFVGTPFIDAIHIRRIVTFGRSRTPQSD